MELLTGLFQRVDHSDFHHAFKAKGRESQFSVEGLDAIFDYLEELAYDSGELIELDVIALCCDLTEYKDLTEYNQEFETDYDNWDDVEDVVAKTNNGAIIRNQ